MPLALFVLDQLPVVWVSALLSGKQRRGSFEGVHDRQLMVAYLRQNATPTGGKPGRVGTRRCAPALDLAAGTEGA